MKISLRCLLLLIVFAMIVGHAELNLKAAPTPADPPANAKEQSSKSKKAVAALNKLDVFTNTETWEVSLSYAKDLDQAIALMADLDHVYEIKLGDKVTDAHLTALGKFKEIQILELNFNELVTDDGLKILKGLPQMKRLSLMYVKKATAAGISNLAGLSDLEYLDVEGIALGDAGAKHLENLRKLTHLNVRRCSLIPGSLAHFANLTALREFNLGGENELSDEQIKTLAAMTKLEQLDLGSTSIGDAGVKHLAGLTSITHLNLSRTNLTDAGLENLSGMKKLAYLNIGDTSVKGSGLKHLAGCKDLKSLELQGLPEFTGEGLHHLAGCPNFTSINLSWTGLTDAGLADIKKLKQLKNLDLPPYGHVTRVHASNLRSFDIRK